LTELHSLKVSRRKGVIISEMSKQTGGKGGKTPISKKKGKHKGGTKEDKWKGRLHKFGDRRRGGGSSAERFDGAPLLTEAT